MLLILTSKQDFTADYLIVDLIEEGLPYFRLNVEDIDEAQYLFGIDQSGELDQKILIEGRCLDLKSVRSVWYRRAIHPRVKQGFNANQNIFLAGELRHLVHGLIQNKKINWVNPIEQVSLAELKLNQLKTAQEIGFKIPNTLISTDNEKLANFASRNKSGTICKPIFHGLFFDKDSRYSIYTKRVTASSFKGKGVGVFPVLLQEEVPRVSDVRVTFIGDKCFSADIKGEKKIVDWRDPDLNVSYSISSLPDEVEDMCRKMMKTFGLKYGAFDFIRTPDNQLVFLEVNPTGEWAWLQEKLGFQMKKAFINLLYNYEL